MTDEITSKKHPKMENYRLDISVNFQKFIINRIFAS